MASITLIHTNDTHGRLTPAKLPFLLSLRAEVDLYFDTGDCIKAGNLAVPVKPDPVWPLLAEAACDAGTIGNRESHVLKSAFTMKLKGAAHPLVCANLHLKRGDDPLPSTWTLDAGGMKVGIVGVMVPMVTTRMKTQAASAYLWDQPVPVAVSLAASLRPQVDLLIALTHIGLAKDRLLAEATTEFDLILGGHSHTVLEQPEVVNGTPICQGGSHARFIGRYVWDSSSGLVESELVPWP
ncbi:MAG: bifunctional metallophosphatase/5'-nucleotidase [Armatimonadetes bacterium]|nr:bifunctional metallophosphatase/5'-nucleotidase [Armatimonadota bacterium]